MSTFTLTQARLQAGLSRPKAARKLGISKETLVEYEKGSFYPPAVLAQKIVKLYGIDYGMISFL